MTIKNIESSLLKNIKYNLLTRWMNGDSDILHVDNILSMAGAFVFPYLDTIIICSDENIIQKFGTLKYIVESLRRFSNKNKSILSQYSFDALQTALQCEWLSNIDLKTKSNLIKCVSLVQKIDSEGWVSIKGNEIGWNAIVNKGFDELNPSYGYVSYSGIPVADDNMKQKRNSVKTLPNSESNLNNTNLDDFWCNNILCDNFYGNMPFVWKLHISESNYSRLKDLLLIASNQKKSLFLSRHAEKLLVYGAEWYRREYEGK